MFRAPLPPDDRRYEQIEATLRRLPLPDTTGATFVPPTGWGAGAPPSETAPVPPGPRGTWVVSFAAPEPSPEGAEVPRASGPRLASLLGVGGGSPGAPGADAPSSHTLETVVPDRVAFAEGSSAAPIGGLAFGAPEPAGSAWEASAPPPPQFVLRRLVGRGGMGEVWEAVQTSLGRMVAVKTIRPELLEGHALDPLRRRRVIREFEQEALISARLEHPNIAPVHDLGSTGLDRPPMLAMKLVRGESWHAILRRDFESMTPAELLARHLPILEDMAQAVAFAHAQGIIHRDLKPEQVMVGAFGETLLMDWGLAVQVSDAPGDVPPPEAALPHLPSIPTLATASNPAGTPAMMAPEQVDFDTARLGPWTDVYLLGGTLYYILTGGVFPHPAKSSLDAMKRAMMGDVDAPEAAAPGRMIPPQLAALAMRSMEADPRARLADARAFIEELKDYMSGASRRRDSEEHAEAAAAALAELRRAEAGPAGGTHALYVRHGEVAGRLARALEAWPENERARALVAENLQARLDAEIASGDLVLAQVHLDELRAHAVGASAEGRVAATERRLAASLARRRRQHRQRIALMWVSALLLLGHGIGMTFSFFQARWNAAALAEKNDLAEANLRLAEAERRAAVRNLAVAREQGERANDLVLYVFDELKDRLEEELTPERGVAPDAADEIKHAVAGGVVGRVSRYFAELHPEDWPAEVRLEHADRMNRAVARYLQLGRFAEGLELSSSALALMRGATTPDDARLAGPLTSLGKMHLELGDHAAARAAYEEAVALLDAASDAPTGEAASARALLAELLFQTGDTEGSVALFEEVVAARREHLGPDDPLVATSLSDLAMAQRTAAQFDAARASLEEALRIQRAALAPDDPVLAATLNNFAQLLQGLGRLDDALAAQEEATAIWRHALGEDHPNTLVSLNNVGLIQKDLGRHTLAIASFERALAGQERVHGPDSPRLGSVLTNLGGSLQQVGRLEEALVIQQRGLALREAALGPDHRDVAFSLNNLGSVLRALGRAGDALPLYERAAGIFERDLGPAHPNVAIVRANVAECLRALGRREEAVAQLEQSLAIVESSLGAGHPFVARLATALAAATLDLGRAADAKAWAARARSALGAPPSEAEGDLLLVEGRLARGDGEEEKALAAFVAARAAFEATVGPAAPKAREAAFRAAEQLDLMGRGEEARGLVRDLAAAGWPGEGAPTEMREAFAALAARVAGEPPSGAP